MSSERTDWTRARRKPRSSFRYPGTPLRRRRPGVAGPEVPAAAAVHPVRGLKGASGVVHRRTLVVIGRVPVRAPLPDVPVHVVQPPGVRIVAAHRCRVDETILRGNGPRPVRILRLRRPVRNVCYRGQALGIVTIAILCRRPSPAGVFPLRFRRQPVRHPLLAAQPLGEGHGVVPAHGDHRVLVGLVEPRVQPGVSRILLELLGLLVPAPSPLAVLLGLGLVSRVVHEPPELAAGDLVHPEVKRPGDPHSVLRFLVAQGVLVGVRRAHLELARGDEHKLHVE